jgi:hypothetical protein
MHLLIYVWQGNSWESGTKEAWELKVYSVWLVFKLTRWAPGAWALRVHKLETSEA